MARNLTPAMASAVQASSLRPAFFVSIAFVSETIYLWSGFGSIAWNGNIWSGIGSLGTVSVIEEGGDVQARGISLTLSGINPNLLKEILTDYRVGLPATVQLGLFDTSGNIIADPIMSFSGKTDQPSITMGGDTASIQINCESLLMSLNTPCERRYDAEDQAIDYPDDTGFSFVNSIQEISIYWGTLANGQNNFTQGV